MPLPTGLTASRSTAVLKDFLHNADGLRTLDISSNSLDDSSSFSLLSSLESSSQSLDCHRPSSTGIFRRTLGLYHALSWLYHLSIFIPHRLSESPKKTLRFGMVMVFPPMVFPWASARLVTFFLADNLIRNPPALIERLRRLNRWKLLLDETLPENATTKPGMRIHLPFLWLF